MDECMRVGRLAHGGEIGSPSLARRRHYDPDGLADEDLRVLQEFLSFLKRLD